MRGFAVLAVLHLAACEVTTRNATDLAFLREADALIDERDRCGLYRLVSTQPGVMRGSDPLAAELRNFMVASRGECRFGKIDPDDVGWTRLPDMDLIEMARSQGPSSQEAQTQPNPPSPASWLNGTFLGRGEESLSARPGLPDPVSVGSSINVPGASKPHEISGSVARSSGPPDTSSAREKSGRDSEGGSGSRNKSRDENRDRGRGDKERKDGDRDRGRRDKH